MLRLADPYGVVPFGLGLILAFVSAVISALFWFPVLGVVGPLFALGALAGAVVVLVRKRPHRMLAFGLLAGLALGLPFLYFRLALFLNSAWMHAIFG